MLRKNLGRCGGILIARIYVDDISTKPVLPSPRAKRSVAAFNRRRVMIQLTKLEAEVLKDICRGVNNRMHDRALYEALEAQGFISKCLSGNWASTRAGRFHEAALQRRKTEFLRWNS